MTNTDSLAAACLELARIAKWTQKPIDATEITALAASFSEIAERYCTDDFYGRELVERAVRYIDGAHGQPMGDSPDWFDYMLRALLEVARPNSGLDEEGKAFLKDMREGIEESLAD